MTKFSKILFILFQFSIVHFFQIDMASTCWASEQVGTFTQVQGTVKIFSHPSKTLQKESQGLHALFEGEYYLVGDAKVGDSIEKGNIVRTAPDSKARVIYENGDQINVAPGTAYRVNWDQDTKESTVKINLAYGKIRGIVEKGGPRSHLQVRTKSALMGVRGTDFFIAENGKDGTTEISILRGTVEVSRAAIREEVAQAKPQKPIQLAAGFSAEITAEVKEPPTSKSAQAPAPIAEVSVRKTTQEQYTTIQDSSTLTPQPKAKQANPEGKESTPVSNISSISKEEQKKIENLEKKAAATVMKDIKVSDPVLYVALQKSPNKEMSIEEMNRSAVQSLKKTAPSAPEKRKPSRRDIEDSEDAYEKYFKELGAN